MEPEINGQSWIPFKIMKIMEWTFSDFRFGELQNFSKKHTDFWKNLNENISKIKPPKISINPIRIFFLPPSPMLIFPPSLQLFGKTFCSHFSSFQLRFENNASIYIKLQQHSATQYSKNKRRMVGFVNENHILWSCNNQYRGKSG